MAIARRTVALSLSTLLAGSALFLAGVSPAAADPAFDALQSQVAGCGDVTVGGDVDASDQVLTISCDTTIDLADHTVSVERVVVQPGTTLTVVDSGDDGTLVADSSSDGGAGIQTSGATLHVSSGTVRALGSGSGAGIGGDDDGDGGTVTIAEDADVTATRIGGGGRSTSGFGTWTVDGTLRLIYGSYVNNPRDVAGLTVGETGRVLAVENEAGYVYRLQGPGQIVNHGAITLSVHDETAVLDHRYTVSFGVPGDVSIPDPVTVLAPSFEAGARTLPESTRDGYTFAGWTLDGEPFDKTSTLPGTSEDGDPVYVRLVATYTPSATTVFRSDMANCDITKVTLTGDVSLPDEAFTLGCERIIDLDGHALAVRRLDQSGRDLTVQDSSTGGKLTVDSSRNDEKAAIRTTGGTLTISSGAVEATGGRVSASIGADGSYGGEREDPGTVVIDGGAVTASGTEYGAGIGGGIYGSGGTLTINGGTVTATAPADGNGTGLGAGYSGASAGDITIDGGTVTASSAGYAPAIAGVNGSLTVGEDGDLTASAANSTAIGDQYSGSRIAIRVDGVLRLPSGSLDVSDRGRGRGPMLVVGATGRVVGATQEHPETGASITGDGQIDNGGSVTLATAVEVLDHHYVVDFDVPQDDEAVPDVTVLAPTFEDGARTLPDGLALAGHTFTGWQLDAADDGLGDGTTFDETSTLPGSSTDGSPVRVHLVATYAPSVALSRPSIKVGEEPLGSASPVVGTELTAGEGAGTPSTGTVTYLWTVSGDEGPTRTATGTTFTPAAGDVGRTVTLTKTIDADGDVRTRSSRPTTPVSEATFDAPTITISGAAQVDKTVTAVVSDTPAPAGTTITGQWFRRYENENGYQYSLITNATSPAYRVQESDYGYGDAALVYRETRALDGYTTLVTSSPEVEVLPGQFAFDEALPGKVAAVGTKLTAAVDPDAPAGSLSYRWVVDGETVSTLRSYRPTIDDLGKSVTVTVVGSAYGYAYRARTSTTDPVGLGTFADAGTEGVTIHGTPTVGSTLTAGSDVETDPAPASTTGRWFRGTTPIPGATTPSYVLTADDVTSETVGQIHYTETRKLKGYEPLVSDSNALTVTAADGGTGTAPDVQLAAPSISGTPQVGRLLTVVPGTVTPADALTAYVWRAGTTAVGSGETYTPSAGDLGKTITVTETASSIAFTSATKTSLPTTAVVEGTFDTAPTAAISGVLKVGEPLTAVAGPTSPTATTFTYRWFADGEVVEGATDRRFTPTSAQVGDRITVEITAHRDGYADASDESAPTPRIASSAAPTLTLTSSVKTLRVGQGARLTWTTDSADTVSAGGGWGSLKALSGSEIVKPSAIGTTTYSLTATNANGSTTAQVAVVAKPGPATLTIRAARSVKQGRTLAVKVTGLAPGEVYAIRVAGTVRATGRASAAGVVSRKLTISRRVSAGPHTVSVTGSADDRYGQVTIRVKKR